MSWVKSCFRKNEKKEKKKKIVWHPRVDHLCAKKRPNGTHIVTSNESDNCILCVLVTLLTRAASGSQAITFWNETPLKRPSSTNTNIFNVYFILRRNFNSNHFVDIENNSTVFVIRWAILELLLYISLFLNYFLLTSQMNAFLLVFCLFINKHVSFYSPQWFARNYI